MSSEKTNENEIRVSESTESYSILIAGVDAEVASFVKNCLPNFSIIEYKSDEQFLQELNGKSGKKIVCSVIGAEFGSGFIIEAAQVLKTRFPASPLFHLAHSKLEFNYKFAKRNGYDYVGMYPMDREYMEKQLVMIAQPEALGARAYKPVKILDLNGSSILNFDTFVFLPLNNRVIKFSHKDQKVGDSRIEKLKARSKSKLYVHNKDLDKFYDHAASYLKELGKQVRMTETERKEKLESAVRSLFAEIFDSSTLPDRETGREVLDSCKSIVSTYITGDSKDNWYQKILDSLGGSSRGFYSATDVSTIASLIALGTDLADPMDVAVAGLLRDLSLSDFPMELLEKPINEWDEQNRNFYLKHPQLSVNLIKEKKMILTRNSENAILMHEERYNGLGFPKQLQGDSVSIEAQIITLAEHFLLLTSGDLGVKSMKPMDALQNIRNQRLVGPELIHKFASLLKEGSEE